MLLQLFTAQIAHDDEYGRRAICMLGEPICTCLLTHTPLHPMWQGSMPAVPPLPRALNTGESPLAGGNHHPAGIIEESNLEKHHSPSVGTE
jgi:hypothetical protein